MASASTVARRTGVINITTMRAIPSNDVVLFPAIRAILYTVRPWLSLSSYNHTPFRSSHCSSLDVCPSFGFYRRNVTRLQRFLASILDLQASGRSQLPDFSIITKRLPCIVEDRSNKGWKSHRQRSCCMNSRLP